MRELKSVEPSKAANRGAEALKLGRALALFWPGVTRQTPGTQKAGFAAGPMPGFSPSDVTQSCCKTAAQFCATWLDYLQASICFSAAEMPESE
jgi:hypothetical protein